MSARFSVAAVTRVHAVQRARRQQAEMLMHTARAAADAAHSKEADASADARAAMADWDDLLGQPHFAPEWSWELGAALNAREADLAAAKGTAQAAEEVSAERESRWQAAQAQVRASEALLRSTRRDATRKHEERRLEALHDRVALAWSVR